MENPITEELIAFKREVMESLYVATCTVTVTRHTEDRETGRYVPEKVVVLKDEPCRLIRQSAKPTEKESAGASAEFKQTTHLMLAPECDIPDGSLVEVTMYGVTRQFDSTGEPQRYSDHQTLKILARDENIYYA